MIFYVLAVAIVNLGFGFAVAAYLARQHRRLVEVRGEPSPANFDSEPSVLSPSAGDSDVEFPAAEDVSEAPASPDVAQNPADASVESARSVDIRAESQPESAASPSEAAIADLQAAVQQYCKRLNLLDDKLRSCAQAPDANKIQSCLNSLQETNREYLQDRDQAHAVLEQLGKEQEGDQAIHDDLQTAVKQQTAQVENTSRAIEDFDYQADLKKGCRDMMGETSKLLDVNHDLRDTLDKTSIAVARSQQRLGSSDLMMQNDPLTELPDRVGLEAGLHEWWQNDPDRTRQLCLAMLDIDQFTLLNERYGHKVGDLILHAIAQLLSAESRGESSVARFAGQQFMLVFPNVDIRHTTNVVDRIRQAVEKAHFQWHDCDIRVTISCAVVEAGPEDTSETLFDRADATLREAKRYGRNRSFIHEGKYPAPVVPPSFALEDKFIEL